MTKHKWPYCAVILSIFLLVTQANGQNKTEQSGAQSISQTGLLPIYGVDFAFDYSWIDSAQFPSKSTQYPNQGVNATFQQIWEALKPGGFNVIRFPVDVRDTQAAAIRVANLCVWARRNNVKLVAVLGGAERGKQLGPDFSTSVSGFVRALLVTLRANGQQQELYSQILAYQLENEMNHQGLHGAMSAEAAQQRLGQAARKLRNAEQEALKDTGLNATPLMASASFDYELIMARALVGATLTDDSYAKAYQALKKFLLELAAEPDIDMISVDWFAGSLGAGSVDRFPGLLENLVKDLSGKQLIFTTGYSTAFHSSEEQKNFYSLTFANLADYRASKGIDSPFIGLFFHEAVNGKEINPEPPKPNVEGEMPKWDWAAKADELTRMWNGQAGSDVMAWWLKKAENNMGLLTLKLDSSNNATVTRQPAQESLQQIATTVSEANSATAANNATAATNSAAAADSTSSAPTTTGTEVPATTDQQLAATDTVSGSPPSSELKSKAQQALMLLLDVVIDRLSKRGSGTAGDGNYSSSNPADNSSGGPPGGAPSNVPMPSIALAKEGVSFAPASPHKDEKVTFNVTVRNKSTDLDASALVMVLVDNSAGVLSQVTGISVGRNGTQDVPMEWTPGAEGNYSITVQVYDASGSTQLAILQIDPLTVVPAAAAASTTEPAPPVVTAASAVAQTKLPFGSPQIREFTVGTPGQALTVGQTSSVALSLANPFARPLLNVKASLLVDGKQTQTRAVATLMPQQNRSVIFSNVPFAQAGIHEVKIILESGDGKRVVGSLAKQVQVGPKVMTPVGPTKTPGVVGPIKPVRPVVPPISVGGIKVAVSSGAAAGNDSSKSAGTRVIGPMKPEGTKETGTAQPGGTRVVGPKPIGGTQTGGVRVNDFSKPDNTKVVGPSKPIGTDSSRSGGTRVIVTPKPEGARRTDSPRAGDSKVIAPAKPENTRLPSGARGTKVTPGKRSKTNSDSNRPASASTGNANRSSNGNANANTNSNRSPRSSQNQNRPRVMIRNANRP